MTLKPDFEKLFVGKQTMKTKSLILTALLTVAGTAGLMAQSSNVYSQNIVGYVSQSYVAGYQLCTVPFKASPDNTVLTVMPAAVEGLTIYKFKRNTGGYDINSFSDGAWDFPSQTLSPGDGYWLYAPAAFTNTFVGEVVLNSTNTILNGYTIIGAALPKSGKIQTDFGFVAQEGDTVYQQKSTGGYNVGSFSDGVWDTEPNLKLNEGFWMYSAGAHPSWNINFNVGP